MYKRLYTFIADNNILYEYQFGFRRNYSTTLALIDVIDNIYCSLDNDDTVVGIFLDLQKAFDTVKHAILLYKMYNYGIVELLINGLLAVCQIENSIHL